MRLLSALLLVLLVAAPSEAQRPGNTPARAAIAGRIVDAGTAEPLAAAAVALYALRDSSLITGAITGPDGSFAIEGVRPGRFWLRASFLGYEPAVVADVTLRPGGREDVGTLALRPDAEALGEVQVTGERAAVEVRVDRTVYNTEDQPVTTGGSATDVLGTLPSVEVDEDGNVSFRGNPNVAVYVDGRPVPVSGAALAAFLRGLPAGNVARVEIIPNPSAKFDPEGIGGILNIVLKDAASTPTGGSVTLAGGTGPLGEAQASLNTDALGARTFTSYAFRYNSGGSIRETNETPLDGSFALDQAGDDAGHGISHTINAQADWSLPGNARLGTSLLFSAWRDEDDGVNRYDFIPAGPSLPDSARALNTEDEDGWTGDASVTFGKDFAEGHGLTAEARYSYNLDSEASSLTQTALETTAPGFDIAPQRFRDRVDEKTDEAYAQLDYTRPLGAAKLEAGYKGTYRRIDNDFVRANGVPGGGFEPDPGQNNRFIYDETTHAGYALLTRAFGPVEVQGGLRVERTDFAGDLRLPVAVDTADFERGRMDLFPSASAIYKLSDVHQLTVQYSRRIQRPRSRILNPFSAQTDPLFVFAGNPNLTPEYTDAFELGYAYVTGPVTLQLQPYYRRTTDVIRRDLKRDRLTNRRTLTFENFASSESYGAEATLSFQRQRLRGFLSVNAYQESTDGGNIESDLSAEATGYTLRGNVSVPLTATADVQVSGFYRSAREIPRGRIEAFQVLNVALRQRLGERATLTFRASDPFDQRRFQFRVTQDEIERVGYRKRDSQRFVLALTYQFGEQVRGPRPPERSGGRGGDEEGM